MVYLTPYHLQFGTGRVQRYGNRVSTPKGYQSSNGTSKKGPFKESE